MKFHLLISTLIPVCVYSAGNGLFSSCLDATSYNSRSTGHCGGFLPQSSANTIASSAPNCLRQALFPVELFKPKIEDAVESCDGFQIQTVIDEVKDDLGKKQKERFRVDDYKKMASDVFSTVLWKAAEKANMVAYRVIMSDPFTGSLVRQSAVDLALVKAVEARNKKVVQDLSDCAELIQLGLLTLMPS